MILTINGIKAPLESVTEKAFEGVRENATEMTKEFLIGALIAVRDFFVDTIGAITLIGCGLLIILKIAGFKEGYNWAGILFTINVMVKYSLGG